MEKFFAFARSPKASPPIYTASAPYITATFKTSRLLAGDNISGSTVVYCIGFNCNDGTTNYDKQSGYQGGRSATYVATQYARNNLKTGALSDANIATNSSEYKQDRTNLISSVNLAGQYGDIAILDIRVTYNALTWFGNRTKVAYENAGEEGIVRGFTRYNIDFTYAVPLLKYVTVE